MTWIVGAIFCALILSVLFYERFPNATDASQFEGAFFASWLSGIALTAVITVAVTIATLARPHQDVFEARARNLLKRQTGPHIDYIIPQIQQLLKPFCESAIREMTITDYDEKTKLFRVNQYTDNQLKSYLNDIPVRFDTQLEYKRGTPAPDGEEQCSLTYLKVDGTPVGGLEHFADQIVRPFPMVVHPNESCRIEHRMVYWVEAESEQNRHMPTRFTNSLRVTVHNQLASRQIVAIHPSLNGKEVKIPIDAGTSAVVVDLKDLAPGEWAYDFRLGVD